MLEWGSEIGRLCSIPGVPGKLQALVTSLSALAWLTDLDTTLTTDRPNPCLSRDSLMRGQHQAFPNAKIKQTYGRIFEMSGCWGDVAVAPFHWSNTWWHRQFRSTYMFPSSWWHVPFLPQNISRLSRNMRHIVICCFLNFCQAVTWVRISLCLKTHKRVRLCNWSRERVQVVVCKFNISMMISDSFVTSPLGHTAVKKRLPHRARHYYSPVSSVCSAALSKASCSVLPHLVEREAYTPTTEHKAGALPMLSPPPWTSQREVFSLMEKALK